MTGNPKAGGILHPWRGKAPRVSADAFIAETAVIIGDVEIGPGSGIWYGCVLRGDFNEIRIGRDTNIQDGSVVHCDSRTDGTYSGAAIIGDGVTVGHMGLIHACTLEDRCMVGMRATVMDGAVVGEGALVAAGALVAPKKHIPAGELWAGAPARFVRKVGPKDRELLDYIWPGYRDLGAAYMDAGLDGRRGEETP